jgi:hypothetical protein
MARGYIYMTSCNVQTSGTEALLLAGIFQDKKSPVFKQIC